MSLSYFIKKRETEQLRGYCIDKNTEKITEFFQEIENKKAKEQNRIPSTVFVENIDGFMYMDDEFIPEYNAIYIYFKESRDAPDIYKSFVHEEKHALQFHLSNRDVDELSQFDKELTIAHKLSFYYNIDDDSNPPAIQYLYNFNELDSKVDEAKELLAFIQNDIDNIDRYKGVLRDMLQFCEIYNKQGLKEYQSWLIKHCGTYYKNPKKDPYGIIQSVINAENKLNIDIKKFISNTLCDFCKDKYLQLIHIRKDLNKLFAITKQEPEKRTDLIEKYKQKEMKIQNRENINIDIER